MRRGRAATVLVLLALVAALSVPIDAHAHETAGDYRWVGDAVAPEGRRAEVSQQVAAVWTPDLQAVLSVPAADGFVVELQPVVAGDLPDGLHADGNAYAVTGAGVASLELAVPHDATGALYSSDGTGWTAIRFEPGAGAVVVPVDGDGLYVAVTDHDVRGRSGGAPAALLAGPPLLLLALLAVKRRRSEPVTT